MIGVLYFIKHLMVSRWGIKYTCFEMSSQIYIACIIYCCFVFLFAICFMCHLQQGPWESLWGIFFVWGFPSSKIQNTAFSGPKYFLWPFAKKMAHETSDETNCLLAYFYLCFCRSYILFLSILYPRSFIFLSCEKFGILAYFTIFYGRMKWICCDFTG